MYLSLILAIIIVTPLVYICIKLTKLQNILEENVNTTERKWKETIYAINYHWKELHEINSKITELSDVHTIDNPAWGDNSASQKKKANIIKLYADHIAANENLPSHVAVRKSTFVVHQFGEKSLIDDMTRKYQWHKEAESEADLRRCGSFLDEVTKMSNSLRPNDIYIPLFIAVTENKYKKGERVWQRPADSYYRYEDFVKDAAIIYKLSELGILKKTTLHKSDGKYDYILMETDLDALRRLICNGDDEQCIDNLNWGADYASWRGHDMKLPFVNGIVQEMGYVK